MERIAPSELDRVRRMFFIRGESVASWAIRNGFQTNAVYQVLSGRCRASRGESHRIAVALGLKPLLAETPTASAAQRNKEQAM